jgi:hypothetical protein
MSVSLILSAVIAAVGGDSWHVINQVYEGEPLCGLGQVYADGSSISIVVTGTSFAGDEFLLTVDNPAWSIKKGDDLGKITVSTPTGAFSSEAAASEREFRLTGKMATLDPFIGSAKVGGFKLTLVNKQRLLGEYAPGGLDESLPAFQSCLVSRFDPVRDPFKK